MGCIDILFTELLHHTCLMYGLKQTFEAMPHLNKRVVEVGDRSIIIDNAIAPPPTLCNPQIPTSKQDDKKLSESIVLGG